MLPMNCYNFVFKLNILYKHSHILYIKDLKYQIKNKVNKLPKPEMEQKCYLLYIYKFTNDYFVRVK